MLYNLRPLGFLAQKTRLRTNVPGNTSIRSPQAIASSGLDIGKLGLGGLILLGFYSV